MITSHILLCSRSSDQMVQSEAQWAAVQEGQRNHGQMREAGDSSVKRLPRDRYVQWAGGEGRCALGATLDERSRRFYGQDDIKRYTIFCDMLKSSLPLFKI